MCMCIFFQKYLYKKSDEPPAYKKTSFGETFAVFFKHATIAVQKRVASTMWYMPFFSTIADDTQGSFKSSR